MALDPRQANAISKAVAMALPATVTRVEYGTYLVPSTSREGLTHVVTGTRVDGADLACDCEAGSWGKPCVHAAAVMIAKMEHTAGVRVIGPAPIPAPDAPAAPAVTVTRHAGLKRVALV